MPSPASKRAYSLDELIDLRAYPLRDTARRAALVAECRAQLRAESCVVLPGFVTSEVAREMASEAAAIVPLAHRRDALQTAYANNPAGDDVDENHATRRKSPYRQWVVASDLLPHDGRIHGFYRIDELATLLAEILEQTPLYRSTDPLLSCTVTAMQDGDEHGWHFDSNDFVISLLLQSPEQGGAFEFAPYIRGDAEENFDDVAAVMAGDMRKIQARKVEPGTLMIFCGRRALHRVSPIRGATPRLIALFCFDRTPDMQFSDSARTRAVGRTQVRPAAT